jgi:hypothetical protein
MKGKEEEISRLKSQIQTQESENQRLAQDLSALKRTLDE